MATLSVAAQPFTGTNSPNTGKNFDLTLGAGTTNLSLTVSNNSTAYSYLLLKAGGTASLANYDFAARLNGQTNQISLEAAELAATNYGLTVFTPATSIAQSFSVNMLTNHGAVRSATYPAVKPVVFSTTGSLSQTGNGAWHYFQVDVPTNLPGWRLVLSHTGSGNPNLYVRRGALPTTGTSDKSSTGQLNDTIVFTNTEATNATYYVGVNLPSGAVPTSADYTLSTELGFLKTLTWDPGTTHEGTQIFTNTSPTGGDYYFKITPQATSVGAWRTALKVVSGEADVYLRKDATFASGVTSYTTKQSFQAGSDGFIMAPAEYTAGQDCYILVRATPGAEWTLVSGEAFVSNLGTLAAAGSSASSTNVVVGPEGMRFFRTTVPAGTLAWRLGLNGATNEILVRKALVPTFYNSSSYDLKQASQMLVVPSYLTGNTTYFLAVPGVPDSVLNLDSRQQEITDLPFVATTNITSTAYGYVTYRIQVPVQQIAWMTALNSTAGDANLSIRRGSVANEWNNDAFSEVGGSAHESVLLVPPSLSDGTFYVTVYGRGAYTAQFTSGNPTITDVSFAGVTTNDVPTLAGWRLYRVPDISSQLGFIGWDLYLSGQPSGTEIALRRNAVPGRWNYRNNSTTVSTSGNVDHTSTRGFLQRQDHPADIWYIGVYSPNVALGNFVLDRRTYSATNVEPVGGNVVVDQPANQFRYFRIDVPAGIIGWDLRITNVTSGDPRLVVRRDRLPDSLTSHTENSSSGWSAAGATSWPGTYQWAAGSDWTGYNQSSVGVSETDRVLGMGMGNPLEPGTYYVGVTGPSTATTPLSYTLSSRFIGAGQAIEPIPFAPNGATATITNLAPREVVFYAVNIPSNTPSLRLKLAADNGESMLLLQRDVIPNVGAVANRSPYSVGGGSKISKTGDEVLYLLPPSGQTNLPVGIYYAAVVSEGMNPTSTRIGTNSSSATLTSLGELPVQNLGSLGGSDLLHTDTIPSAEIKAYQFSLPAGLHGVEVRLESKTGNPKMALRLGTGIPAPTDAYGNYGGQSATWSSTDLIYLPSPASGTYTLTVQAGAAGSSFVPAGFTIRLHAIGSAPLAFDGGIATVVNQPNDSWRFFALTVPTNAFGWDLRLTNVLSGDPRMVVRRGLAPFSLSSVTGQSGSGWNAAGATTWPIGYQWAAGTDYTGYSQEANGANRSGHFLTMGMGNPLEPGDYIIGIYSGTGSGSSNPMSYTLASRGIGSGFSIPVQSVPFLGGTVTVTDLAPRDFRLYSIVVPSNTPNWKMTLTTNAGDSMIAIQKDALPNVGAGNGSPFGFNGGYALKKVGNEIYTILPPSSQTTIAAGTYYFAIVSEGMNPSSPKIGTNTSSATFNSLGSVGINNLGTLIPGTDISSPGALAAGELQFYQFTVDPGVLSMQLRLTNRVGNPKMTLRRGSLIPKPSDSYGVEGGSSSEWSDVSFIDIPNPTPGLYTLTVQAAAVGSAYVDAGYAVSIQATGSTPLAFDGGTINVTNQPSGVWRYFYVTIPANTLGWDLRIRNITSGDPRLVVRRDQLPTSLSTITTGSSGWAVASATSWPSGYQWAASSDWTEYSSNADGANESGHIIAGGMGSPLSPGNYYVGVFNGTGTGSSNPMSYTLVSRGIGDGYIIPVTPIGFTDSVSGAGLPVRETAYYKITVPSNAPNWKLKLSPTVGQTVLTVNKGSLPIIVAGNNNATAANGGRRMQRTGDEFYFLLPMTGQTNVPAGDYFIGVTSEGMNPTSTRSGTNSVSYQLTSLGTVPVEDLGTVSTTELVTTNSLMGGDVALYYFNVPEGVPSMEVQLDAAVGGAKMTLRRGAAFPAPEDDYGNDGGEADTWDGTSLITIASPVATNYALVVQTPVATNVANYTLRIRGAVVNELNFAANLNTNGLSHTASGTLSDNQRAYYKIQVPATNDNAAVIGWRLNLNQTTGAAMLRARKDVIPSDAVTSQMPFTAAEAVLVPPFLTPGTWYVEVKATGTTTYTLSSGNVQLERIPWQMPMIAQPSTTPGLSGSDFGDSGVQTNGVPLPGDQGVDVTQGGFHYYAVDVPEFNGGIMRVVLEAISGNPNFYLRFGSLPTVTHNNTGVSGSLYDRILDGTGTEYANWVAIDGKYEKSLTPGRWYVAVRAAGNSNARYRLRLSTGNVDEIPIHGANLVEQVVAAKDFRYYRVTVPTNAPAAWQVSFNQQVGDVLMYVRDTTPPGQGDTVTQFKDWSSDNKNSGPYSTYDASGTYTLNVPPLRPGHTYYLGFRGITDSTFTLTTSTNGNNIAVSGTLDFYNGSISNVIPAFSKLTFRMDVPSDARRIRYTNNAPASLRWYLEQGTLPTLTTSDDWNGSGSVQLNQAITGTWPWMPAQMYYLTVTNTSATPQTFNVQMDGRNCVNDDNDSDGLPDCWEQTYFGGTSATATGDPDNDGNNNLTEYQDGTDPTLSTSMLARLSVVTTGVGTFQVSPATGPYPYGTQVTLTATAGQDHLFGSWSGTGVALTTNNPLTVTMTTNRVLNLHFAYDYGMPGLTRADYQFTNTLASSVGNPPDLVAINTNRFFTNMVVNGITRTVLRFASGNGLVLQPTTTVFPTNVYTVDMLFRLDTVAGYRRLLDAKNGSPDQGLYVRDGKLVLYPNGTESPVCVTNNTWHHVVFTRDAASQVKVYVDGTLRLTMSDTSGYAVINAAGSMRFFKDNTTEESAGYVARIRNFASALPEEDVGDLNPFVPFVFSNIGLNASGDFTFTLNGPDAVPCTIQGSSDLTSWSTITNIVGFPGAMNFEVEPSGARQFLRVRSE